MKFHHLLLWVPNNILFSVQENCFTSCDQCGTIHGSCVRAKNNAVTFLVFSFIFRQNLYSCFPSGSVCTWKPRLFMPPMAHCALFQPSLSFAPFRSSRNMISSSIAPLTGLRKSIAFLVLLKRCQIG